MVKIRHMANTFRKIYKKTGNNGNDSDYQLIGNVGVNGVELDIMKGATSEADGEIGLVPKSISGSSERYLSANGTFKEIDGYEQLKTNVGDLSWLDTPTKKDLVAAVNDAYGAAMKNKIISYSNVNRNPVVMQATTRIKLCTLNIETPGLYVVFFRAKVSNITGVKVNNLNICLIQMQLNSTNNKEIGYLATRPHYVDQSDSFNEYDLVRITEPTTVELTFYHNVSGYNMTCEYHSLAALLLEE